MRLILFSLLMVLSCSASSQTRTSFVDYWGKECDSAYAFNRRVMVLKDGVWDTKDYYAQGGQLQMQGYYTEKDSLMMDGKFTFYHRNGKVEEVRYYKNNLRYGASVVYDSAGRTTDSSNWKNGLPLGYRYKWDNMGNLVLKGVYDWEGNGSGYEYSYFENGVLSNKTKLIKGYVADSISMYYFRSGKLCCKLYYENGEDVKMECFDESGAITECKHPVLPDGMRDQMNKAKQYYYRKIREGRKGKLTATGAPDVKGRILGNLCIDEQGKMSLDMIQHIDPLMEEVVIELLNEMDFQPLYFTGRPEKYCFIWHWDFK